MTNNGMERQRDIGADAYANGSASTSDGLTEVICTICFTCNVEQEVADELVRSYAAKKPNTTNEQLIFLFQDEAKRAMMFRTLYARRHKGVNKDTLKSLYTTIPITMNFEEYSNAVDSQLGASQSTDNGFFRVTDTESEVGPREDVINSFRKRALRDGFPEELVEAAMSKVTADTTSYEQFERLLDSVLDDNQAKEEEQRVRDQRLARALQPTLQTLWSDKNPVGTCRNAIWKHYHTTAVSVPELCDRLKDSPEIKLSVYKKPVYSIIHQIDKPFVANGVKECLARWDSNPVVKGIINNYLESTGVAPENMDANRAKLISILPDNIKNQNAPDVWKQYKAVTLIMDRDASMSDTLTAELFADEEAMLTFGARVESYVEDGVPFDAAQRQASEDYCHSLPKDKQMSLFGKVGKFYGKALKFRYDKAADMESLMRESLGEYADQYFERREEMRERKEEMRERKATVRMEAKIAREEREQELREQRADERKLYNQQNNIYAGYNNRTRTGYASQQRYGQPAAAYAGQRRVNPQQGLVRYSTNTDVGGANFAPQIPVFVMAILIHLVVGLLTFIIFGGLKTTFVFIGLALATFGFIRKRVDEQHSIPMIALGYVIVVLAFIFT